MSAFTIHPTVRRVATHERPPDELMAYIRQPGVAAEALDQARDALASVAVAFGAANLEKMKATKGTKRVRGPSSLRPLVAISEPRNRRTHP